MVIEVEFRNDQQNKLIGNTINFPGIVVSEGQTETELRQNICDAINQTIDIAIKEGLHEVYKQYTSAFGLKLIRKQ